MEAPLYEVTTTTNTAVPATAATAVANTVLKGKRTKRQRVQSPIPFALTADHDSFSGDGEGDEEGGDGEGEGGDDSSNKEFQDQSTTQEEEDMANCLILLARGHHRNDSPKTQYNNDINNAGEGYNPVIKTSIVAITTTTTTTNNNNNKFSSRRFMETGNQCSGKAGYYVYECKTCNRTFPSFQALGGHRASHKKPKGINNNNTMIANNENYNYRKQIAASSDEEDGFFKDISPLSLQLSNNISHKGVHNKGSKIHECSICGAEFNSGQALGGHMRRHRGFVGTNTSNPMTNTTLSTARSIESHEPNKGRNLLSLDLDLNLPAEPDPDDKLPFASKQLLMGPST